MQSNFIIYLKSILKSRIFQVSVLLGVAAFIAWFFVSVNSLATVMNDTVPEDPKWRPYEKLVNDIGENDIAAVKADLDHGVNPNALPNDGPAIANESDMAALCAAADGGNAEIVMLLLDHAADPNIGDGWDGDPLTAAVEGDHIDIMELLIKRGARVNEENGDSYALWGATRDGKLDAIKFLLAHGANPNTRYDNGKQGSVLGVARFFHQDAAAKLLRQAGAKE